MCALAVVLMVGGAVAELGGIGLVVFDIRSARQRALTLAPQRIEQALPITPVVGRGVSWDAEGREPTLEERVEHAERRITEVDEKLDRRVGDLSERVSQLALDAADIEFDARRREEAIRAFLREALTADLGRRRWGVALLALGIVVATAGNLLGVSVC